MILTQESTGLSRLCSLVAALLIGYREISAVVPAIILFRTIGISSGSLETARRTRIRIVNKYTTSMMLAKNRTGLLTITDVNNMITEEMNKVVGVVVIYLPLM
ncbi:hypothetical protein ES703_29266 [subsurface metagenome]